MPCHVREENRNPGHAACGDAGSGADRLRGGDRAVSRRDRQRRQEIGHLNKSVHNRIVPDLGRVAETCRAGKDAEAMRALAGLKSRFGYR
jgi:hypothetical protein